MEILLTTGPKLCEIETFEKYLKKGYKSYRVNLGKRKRDNQQIICNINAAAKKVGIKANIYLDLPSDRLRIDKIERMKWDNEWLEKDECFEVFTNCDMKIRGATSTQVVIYDLYKYIEKIKIGDRMLLKDGSYEGVVVNKGQSWLVIKCITRVRLVEMINILWPDSNITYKILDCETYRFLEKLSLKRYCPEYFILSFVKNKNQILEVRNQLDKIFEMKKYKVVSKIETKMAVWNLKEILLYSDQILIGRGDLAPAVGYERVPMLQKNIVETAKKFGVPCIVGTQFMEILAKYGRFYASELNDIFQAIYQENDYIMLAGEGGASDYAEECIETLKKEIINENGKEKSRMKKVEKRMQIMATAGPTLQSVEEIEKAIKMGVKEYRIHMGLRKRDFCAYFENVRIAEKNTGIKTEVLLDLPSSRPRIAEIQEKKFSIGEVAYVYDPEKEEYRNDNGIPLNKFSMLLNKIAIGDRIAFRDGQVVFTVLKKEKFGVKTQCIISNEIIKEWGSCNFPDSSVEYAPIEEYDLVALKKMKKLGLVPDWIAISFISSIKQIEIVKSAIKEIWPEENILLMGKIETEKGIKNIDILLEMLDGIMVARGDLLVNIDPISLPHIQLDIVNKCQKKQKKVIVGTQFFENYARSGVLNRAELSDVALAFREGCDSIMLSMETGNSKYNFESINWINKLIDCEYYSMTS